MTTSTVVLAALINYSHNWLQVLAIPSLRGGVCGAAELCIFRMLGGYSGIRTRVSEIYTSSDCYGMTETEKEGGEGGALIKV